MKKYMLLSLIVWCWLGITFCQAQDSATGQNPVMVTLATGDSVMIQQKMKQAEKGLKNYLKALKLRNDGVVESAMINLIKMKYHYSDLDYSPIIDQLQYWEEQGQTQSMRFLAYFTCHYLQDSENFSWLLQGDDEFAIDSDYLLKIVQK